MAYHLYVFYVRRQALATRRPFGRRAVHRHPRRWLGWSIPRISIKTADTAFIAEDNLNVIIYVPVDQSWAHAEPLTPQPNR